MRVESQVRRAASVSERGGQTTGLLRTPRYSLVSVSAKPPSNRFPPWQHRESRQTYFVKEHDGRLEDKRLGPAPVCAAVFQTIRAD